MNKKLDKTVKSVTPIEEYASLGPIIGLKTLYLKREDLHPYGSHKGRSIPYMIDFYVQKGIKKFAISSSGNAGLAACIYTRELNDPSIELNVFIGNNANKNKVAKLKEYESQNIKIIVKERPLQALTLAEQDGYTSLRQSTNDIALNGYTSLAKEISDEIKALGFNKASIFMGTSSGTTAQALAKYFVDNKIDIQVHVVQTSSCHPIVDAFDISDIPDEKSIADAIVDQTAYRKNAVTTLVRKSGGSGWCVKNEEIEIAQDLVEKNTGHRLSTNGVLGIAGAMQAVYTGYDLHEPVICIVCGE